MNRFTLAAILAALCVTGCAHYEYDLASPPDLARHISGKADEVVRIDPLEYRLRSVENRLVISIYNPTRDPVTLAGERSYVVAPGGQSHPVRAQTIAPDTFVRLILPPMRPGYYQSSPSIGFGLGIGYSRGFYGRRAYPFYDSFLYDEPRYYTYYDESDATYWSWEGESDARVHLVYQGPKETFTHDFTFHRKKV
jgi:hypothetical protein